MRSTNLTSLFTAETGESQRDEFRLHSDFIPSQVDLHSKINSNSDGNLNPVFAEQNFFPSFFRSGQQQLPPSRPFSPRHTGGSTSGRFISNYKSSFDEALLGSGDFTVLRGGTFYPEGEEPYHDYFGSGSSFYESESSGRPFALPLESSDHSEDPFANFKDFADIAGLDTDFSQMIVTYKKKHEPKNIFEQLQLIDDEKSKEKDSTVMPIIINQKLSKTKAKMMMSLKHLKEPKKNEFTKIIDPLVAES